MGGHRRKTAVYMPRTEASGGTSPAHTLIADVQPPGCQAVMSRLSHLGYLSRWPEPTDTFSQQCKQLHTSLISSSSKAQKGNAET